MATTASTIEQRDTQEDDTGMQGICLLRCRSELLGQLADVDERLRSLGIPFAPTVASSPTSD